MPTAKALKKPRFPHTFEKNGRVGRIYKLGNGTFKSYFRYANSPRHNTHGTFDAALLFLDREFSQLDTSQANSLSLHPLAGDAKGYRELEQLLREKAEGASLRDAVQFYLAHRKTKRLEPRTVTVSGTSSPAETWRQAHFGTTANSGDAADFADPDGDGMANLLERALGTDPNAASTAGLPESSPETVGADKFLALTIVKSPAATDVTFAVEVGGDLSIWNSGPDHTTILENTSTLLKVRDNTPMSEATKRFMHLRVTSP